MRRGLSAHVRKGVAVATEPEHHRHMFHDETDAQHKRDQEQLAKFGYSQELKRSLGFFSTFAIAFSFISATNGFYALFYYGLDIGGPAGLIWQWPIIVFGQFMVALVFAEAASHYPLAGGVYQWAKRFMGGTYGWFVAWMFAVGAAGHGGGGRVRRSTHRLLAHGVGGHQLDRCSASPSCSRWRRWCSTS